LVVVVLCEVQDLLFLLSRNDYWCRILRNYEFFILKTAASLNTKGESEITLNILCFVLQQNVVKHKHCIT